MRVALRSAQHALQCLVSAQLHYVGSGCIHTVARPSKKARPTRAPPPDLPIDPNLRHAMAKARDIFWH
eukprot:4643915-Pyramimonas_sp.AAC.1